MLKTGNFSSIYDIEKRFSEREVGLENLGKGVLYSILMTVFVVFFAILMKTNDDVLLATHNVSYRHRLG